MSHEKTITFTRHVFKFDTDLDATSTPTTTRTTRRTTENTQNQECDLLAQLPSAQAVRQFGRLAEQSPLACRDPLELEAAEVHVKRHKSQKVGVRGFHARDSQKGLVRAIVERDLFLSARSSFFFLSSFL